MPSRREYLARLRGAASAKAFSIELTVTRQRVRLVDELIGHAVMNAGRGVASFSLQEAERYLAGVDHDRFD